MKLPGDSSSLPSSSSSATCVRQPADSTTADITPEPSPTLSPLHFKVPLPIIADDFCKTACKETPLCLAANDRYGEERDTRGGGGEEGGGGVGGGGDLLEEDQSPPKRHCFDQVPTW